MHPRRSWFLQISIGGPSRIDVLDVHDALATIVSALQKKPMKSFKLLHWQYPERNLLPNICFEYGCTANTFPPQGLNTIMHPESTILVCISGENTVAIEHAMTKIRKYLRENNTCCQNAHPFHSFLFLFFEPPRRSGGPNHGPVQCHHDSPHPLQFIDSSMYVGVWVPGKLFERF